MDLKFNPDKPDYELVQDQTRLTEILPTLAKADLLAVDLEATGLDPLSSKIITVQLAVAEKAFILDADKLDLSVLKELLENPKPLKVLQNAAYDYKFLKHHLGITVEKVFDTMLAERILTMGKSRQISLLAIAKKYLDIDLDKSIRRSFETHSGELTEQQLIYSALDVITLLPICRQMIEELKKEKLVQIAHLEFQLIPVVADMESKGIKVDQNKWLEMIKQMELKRNDAESLIQEYLLPYYEKSQSDLFGGKPKVINLNSPLQVLEAFRKVGIDIPSTGVKILMQTNHDLAKMLLEYRKYEKLLSAFGNGILEKINPKTGRLHPNFIQMGADTGRFSCNNPNLQQIPATATFRECFIPESGYDFVVCDYSQQELRVLASLSKDPLLMKAYKDDLDLHTLTASEMFKIPLEQFFQEKIPEELKKYRNSAKIINFGIAYGMGPGALSSLLGVSSDEARIYLDRYSNTYKGVTRWLNTAAKSAVAHGYSLTIIGRKRWYQLPEKDDIEYRRLIGDIERQGKNSPIQGTSADMTKKALIYIKNRLTKENLDAFLILAIHDEIVVEASKSCSKQVKKIVEEEMIRAGTEMLENVPVKVGASVTGVWEH
ncbi:hypothetical protein A3A70_00095 [candidate division WWE3 bacterium RIFCSPLOWO2_01_FULL_42_11]|uniref:DNA polymerase I n=1 Tax=candidate division WWE3 bacterium RIFCSPLOWO2_01_FULL_42_11 TaxID=1802627 RepID=A0A1F4VSD4_UNCKA|nr:MAG: hypothetical protein A3A70_00095 [candidate division WWE3 bacterium RIFCSPLOWO2_01_FULL_42_11]